MEEALIDLKKKYNELLHDSMDTADGPTSVKIASANDEVLQLKEELKKREVAHSERIVEMVWKPQNKKNRGHAEQLQVSNHFEHFFFFANSLHI